MLVQKTIRECDGKRICQLLVHPRMFGNDPCPNTTKYLAVTYRCQVGKLIIFFNIFLFCVIKKKCLLN